jgi:hypothetical protein
VAIRPTTATAGDVKRGRTRETGRESGEQLRGSEEQVEEGGQQVMSRNAEGAQLGSQEGKKQRRR